MANHAQASVSLRHRLRIRMVILATCAIMLVGAAFLFFVLRPIAEKIAEQQFGNAAREVIDRLDQIFDPAERILRISHAWIEKKPPGTDHPEAFNHLFQPILKAMPLATSAVAGTSSGEGWMLLRQPDGSWINRLTDIPARGSEQRFFETLADGRMISYPKTIDYDPRHRAWYRSAVAESGVVQWTAPYTFFTTGDPGITASIHFKLRDNRDFVVGIDLMLRDLSELTLHMPIGKHGFSLLVTDDQRVLALPPRPPKISESAWERNLLKKSNDLGIAVLDEALEQLQSNEGKAITFSVEGNRWLAQRFAYPLGNQSLWVITLAPADDFAPDWLTIFAILAGGLAVALVLTLILAERMASQLARPLETLAEGSERIGQLDFEPAMHEPSEIAEIRKLAVAQERMRALLQNNQQQILAQAQVLRTQIETLRTTETQLVESEGRQRQLIRALPDLIWLKDVEGRYLACNHRFEQFFGAPEVDIVGKTDFDFVDPELAAFFRQKDRIAMNNGAPTSNEEWITFACDGHRECLDTTKLPMYDTHGHLIGVLGIGHDITERKQHESQLHHIAHHDVLTTLPNRILLADRLHQAMSQSDRRGTLLAVAYLDLDGFKLINDQHGHDAGDKLLVALAARMRQTLREADTLARLGGDEFVAVLLDLPDTESATPLITRLLAAAAEPITIDEQALQVSASIGVTFYPQAEAVDADYLLRQADQAMYQAKLAGRNRHHVFDTEQDRTLRGFHESIEHIRTGLMRREFVLHYQPKVNMRTGQIIGAEALIRWQHPQRGMLPPSVFLPTIENHPLTIELGEWVIEEALCQMERWRNREFGLPISVNLAARQLLQEDFVVRLRDILARHPAIPPSDLEMEVLETSAIEDIARVSQVIESCREIGVLFSLDDFGTGYSSLTYLKRLSVNQLKIDQSFVRDMLDDPDDLAILGGVLGLAEAFHRQVIAEGVETIEHGTLLLQLGCELAQGYGIARPMPGEDIPPWARSWQPDPAWSSQPPVNREDLPLLVAGIEHRAWIHAVESFLRGKRQTLPLIHHQCPFDLWLTSESTVKFRHQPAFMALVARHERLHAYATTLCEQSANGSVAAMEPALAELDHQRGAFLEQLRLVVDTMPGPR